MRFKPKSKFGISMMIAFIMLFQIIGPVAYAYADSGLGFKILSVDIEGDKAIVNWRIVLDANYEVEEYTYPGNFTVEEEKTGRIIAKDGTVIGGYTVSTEGLITVTTDKGLKNVVEEEVPAVPKEPITPEIPEEENIEEASPKEIDNSSGEATNTLENVEMKVALLSSAEEPKLEIKKAPKTLSFEDSFVIEGVKEKPAAGLFEVMLLSGTNITNEVSTNVITEITATRNGEDLSNAIINGYRPKIGDEIELKLEFTLPNGHNYGAGSVLKYPLPTPLKPVSGSGDLYDKDIPPKPYAEYEVDGDYVSITFNNNIRFDGAEGTGGLETNGDFKITAKFELEESNTSLEQELKLPRNQTIQLDFQPENGNAIDKEVNIKNGANVDYLEWTVHANTEMKDLGTSGIDFTDQLTGNHKYDETSLTVRRYGLDANGDIVFGSEVDVTNEYKPVNFTENSFELKLKGKHAYEIVYRTILGDTDEKSQTFKNTASFNNVDKSETSTIMYGDPLEKSVIKGEGEDREKAHWTIKVNGNKKKLDAGLQIIDKWDSDKHKLENGKDGITVKKSSDSVRFTNFTLDPAEPTDGFTLTFNEEISDEYIIEYTTKPKDLITEDFTVRNTVHRSDREDDEKSVSTSYEQQVISKTNGGPNYKDKTVKWTIELNSAGYTIKDPKLSDVFTYENLKPILVEGKYIDINYGSNTGVTETIIYKDETGADTSEPGKGGFDIEFRGTITSPITITYTTEYDVRDVGNLENYENVGTLTWEEDSKKYSSTDDSTVTINNQQRDKGYKSGAYNYKDKKFFWEVGINYNFDAITSPEFTDTLSNSQIVDRESIKVYNLNLSGGGNGVIDGAPLTEGTDYELEPVGQNKNTFTIAFKNMINTPYRITYESATKNDYYAPSSEDHIVKNNAILTGKLPGEKGYTGSWSKKVEVIHSKDLVTKGYAQVGNSAKLNWTMKLNWGQSTLEDVVITDIVGTDTERNPNQMVYKDSFQIYEMNFSGRNSTPTKNSTVHRPGEGLYDVEFDEAGKEFKIVFNNPIDKAYEIKYDTYFLGKSGDKLENTANLSYKTSTGDNGNDEAYSSKASFSFSGIASAVKGQLEITKVDKDDETRKLPGAEFELWSAQTGGFLIERVSTDVDGVYTFKTKVGQATYYLKETKAPEGYKPDSSFRAVTIQDKGDPKTPNYIEEITITNEKIHQGVKLLKVDGSTPLERAIFKLYTKSSEEVKEDANGNSLGDLKTNTNGELIVNNLPADEYYFMEITPPQYYLLPQGDAAKTVIFKIEENQTALTTVDISNNELKMTNIRGIGSIVITKVDALDNNIPLEGVKFKLYNSKEDEVDSKTTDINGEIIFSNLPYDTYTLEEVAPKDGYIKASSTIKIKLDDNEDGKIFPQLVENQPLRTLVIKKVDSRDNTRVLAGAEFKITKPGGVTVEATTDKNGLIELKELKFGTYTIEEIKAPSGYRLNTDVETVTIDESSRSLVIEIEIENTRRPSGGGTDPKEPEKPTIPGETPGKPEEPTKPVDPAVPTKPTEPTNPGETPEVPEKPVIKEETPKETPKEGEIPVPEESTSEVGTPPTNGTVTVDKDGKWKYTPNPGFTGKDGFTIKVVHPDGTEEEILIEIDVDEIPLGTTTPDGTEKLPQTGEGTLLNNYLTGGLIALLGYTLLRKKKDSQEA